MLNVLPNGDADTKPIVEAANTAGAFLVTQWNKPADLSPLDYDTWLSHITYNGVESGKQIGDALAEAIGGEGGIIALQGILDTGAAKDRFAGLEESLAENSGVELLDQQTANFSRAGGARRHRDPADQARGQGQGHLGRQRRHGPRRPRRPSSRPAAPTSPWSASTPSRTP